jgi:hypothetical protein
MRGKAGIFGDYDDLSEEKSIALFPQHPFANCPSAAKTQIHKIYEHYR